MNKKEVLESYNRNYTEEEYYKQNVTYAFSHEQLQEAMQKLGATDTIDLTTFGYGSICLKSKVKEIVNWILKKEQEKENWLKSLPVKEQNYIIEYELRNYECDYTWNIEPVVDIFKNVFEYNDIMKIFHKITKQ